MFSYRPGGSGDWKASKEGGDGFLLVTVDGMPYWGDAVGQIPFAADKVTDLIEDGTSMTYAIKNTIQTGQKYGDGKIIGGKSDYSNSYDNYMILRGAMWGANGRPITQPITKEEAKKYGLK
jgi:hypothetical protein